MIGPQFRRGPFPFYHRDFHYNNISVDDDFNITGALDWSGARTVLVERFAAYADLMTYPLLSEEENRPIVESGTCSSVHIDNLRQHRKRVFRSRTSLTQLCLRSSIVGTLGCPIMLD